MGGSRDKLDSLRRAAEAAAGSMREVADHLDDVRDQLPQRVSRAWSVDLKHQSDRLRAAAQTLIAEVNADDPWTTQLAARIARPALVGAAALALAATQGAGTAAVEHLLSSEQRAAECIHEVEAQASAAIAGFSNSINNEIDDLRNWLDGALRHPTSTASIHREDPESVLRTLQMLHEPDLGLPNARQRAIELEATIATYEIDAPHVVERIRALRREIEVLAAHDESLSPPQPSPGSRGIGTARLGTRSLGT